MSDELDDLLRKALRPVDPGEGLTQQVMLRLASQPKAATRPYSFRDTAFHGSWLAIAASLVLALILAHQWQVQRTQQGLQARRQLIEALRITDQKLALACRAMNDSRHRASKASGA